MLFKNTFNLPFPELNEKWQSKIVAACTVHADAKYFDDVFAWAQFFEGTKALVTDACGMKTDKKFTNDSEDKML